MSREEPRRLRVSPVLRKHTFLRLPPSFLYRQETEEMNSWCAASARADDPRLGGLIPLLPCPLSRKVKAFAGFNLSLQADTDILPEENAMKLVPSVYIDSLYIISPVIRQSLTLTNHERPPKTYAGWPGTKQDSSHGTHGGSRPPNERVGPTNGNSECPSFASRSRPSNPNRERAETFHFHRCDVSENRGILALYR